MDRTERPSNQRLAFLREQGLVAHSPFSSACVALATILVLLNVLFDNWQRLAIGWKSMLVVASSSSIDEEALLSVVTDLSLVEIIRSLLFWPVVCAAIFLLLLGVARTRFLFHPQALAPHLGRLLKSNPQSRVSSGLAAIAWSCFGLLLPILCVWLSIYMALQLFNRGAHVTAGLLTASIKAGAFVGAPILIALSVIAYTLAHFEFLHRHRMSRRELEAESRDEL